jgi:uncharacterized protein YfaS (alpha-2-macroglobulin family)
MTQKFDIGETVRSDITFTNFSGTAADPTTVTCTARKPDQSVISLTVVAGGSTGVYYAETVVDQTGNWFVHWDGTGDLDVVEEGEFYVRVRKV